MCKNKFCVKLAMLGAVAYVVCHFWGYVIPAELQELHTNLIRISVLGWTGMNVSSFILGVVQWAIWGCLICMFLRVTGKCCKKVCDKKSCCK